MLSTCEFYDRDRVSVLSVPISLMERFQATESDAEDLSALGLRYTPELLFEADDSIAYGAHILEVMQDVERADAQRRADHPESAGSAGETED